MTRNQQIEQLRKTESRILENCFFSAAFSEWTAQGNSGDWAEFYQGYIEWVAYSTSLHMATFAEYAKGHVPTFNRVDFRGKYE